MSDQTHDQYPPSPESEDGINIFRDHFKDSKFRLLEPVDPVVNYSFEIVNADPWTVELTASKWWLDDESQIGHASQTLQTYSIDSSDQLSYDSDFEIIQMDCEKFRRMQRERGLQAAMQGAERLAIATRELDPNRTDGRLFTDGPPDRFVTMREAELASQSATIQETQTSNISDGDTEEFPAVDIWANTPVEANGKYWQLQALPVESPDREKQGFSLFLTEFPQLPANFDEYVEQNGLDDTIYPTEARMIEMARLATIDQAREFEEGFISCLVPGVLEGPDFAPEVARLNGLTDSWQQVAFSDVLDIMSGDCKIVRDESDWHFSNLDSDVNINDERPVPNDNIEF